jgi:ParB family chromosome partitioning protein
VVKRLLAAPRAPAAGFTPFLVQTPYGRALLTVQASNRQGVTLRLHAGTGATPDELANALRQALVTLDEQGRGLQR